MSALALFCLEKNMKVSGSDCNSSELMKKLKKKGIQVSNKHRANNIENQDLVVYSGAIKSNNIERMVAAQKGIPQIERSEFLSLVASCYKNVIAISGTHGKTTTTAMIARCFICAGLQPCVHIGGECNDFNGNLLFNKGDYFITEACEYRKSFLSLKPTCAVVLNVENDHLECYKDEEDLKNCFKTFLKSAKDYRVCLSGFSQRGCVTFSLDKKANFTAKNILRCKYKQTFDVYENNEKIGNFSLNLVGEYNILNALACISVCRKYDIDIKTIQKALETFTGVKRRFEKVGKIEGCEVIKDYAHHPTEISSLLAAACQDKKGEMIVVFQPHTYSRTKNCFDEFVKVFLNERVDKIIFYPTYSAREEKIAGAESKDIYDVVSKKRQGVYYCKSYRRIKRVILDNLTQNSTILIVGAGDIENLANYLIK